MPNLFKQQSIEAIEQCVAEALTKLYGQQVNVEIGGLDTTGGSVGAAMKFAVDASLPINLEAPWETGRKPRFDPNGE